MTIFRIASAQRTNWLDRLSRRILLAGLDRLQGGALQLHDGLGISRRGDGGEVTARVRVHDARFYRRALLGGSLGAAESYLRGDWDCDDLTALFRLLLRNHDGAGRLDGRWSKLAGWFHRRLHSLRANSRSGSRRNIHAHYDLGNDFFGLWLDNTWAYSCGVFEDPHTSLVEASHEKFDRVCRKLDLGPDDHVLEIGSGWGGFAIHAAKQTNCRVTTTTISRQQFELAARRIDAAGVAPRVELREQDYRELNGQFDKLVSIEMIEAVGAEYLDTYFRRCGELLAPHGSLCLQAIVMPERSYGRYLRSVDFIRRYVFPGGCLPSVASMLESVGRTTRLRLVHLEDMAPHYAETIRRWRANFREHSAEIKRLGYPDRLLRLWEYYLCYCEAAFEERRVGVVQLVLDNWACRRDPISIGERAARSIPARAGQGGTSRQDAACTCAMGGFR